MHEYHPQHRGRSMNITFADMPPDLIALVSLVTISPVTISPIA